MLKYIPDSLNINIIKMLEFSVKTNYIEFFKYNFFLLFLFTNINYSNINFNTVFCLGIDFNSLIGWRIKVFYELFSRYLWYIGEFSIKKCRVNFRMLVFWIIISSYKIACSFCGSGCFSIIFRWCLGVCMASIGIIVIGVGVLGIIIVI